MIGRFQGLGARILWQATALAVLVLASCSPQPLSVTREPTTLRLAAAASCETLIREAAARYEADHPWVAVTTEVLNNRLAEETLHDERADIGLLSWRPAAENERDGLWSEPFVRDGVAVVVHPDSPVQEIGLSQLREIYRGHLQEIDGVVLTVVSREPGSGTRAAFEHFVLDGEETSLNAVVLPSADAMVDYVAETPTAIGYVSTWSLDDRVRALPVDGMLSDAESVANGRYPISREFHLASAGEPTGEARQFAQWLLRGGAEMSGAHGGDPEG